MSDGSEAMSEAMIERLAGLTPEKRELLRRRLGTGQPDGAASEVIERRERGGGQLQGYDTAALSFAQQRLFFLDQLEPDSPFYNLASAVRMHGTLNVDALEQSINEVIRRHEAVRTSFDIIDGEPRQLIAHHMRLTLEVVDLREMEAGAREAQVQRLAVEEAQRPFRLQIEPLLRAKLLRTGEDVHVVLLTMHHIISDGWSMGVLIGEMATLYEAYGRGEASPLEKLEIQYADFAQWQRERLGAEEIEKLTGYWRETLAGAPQVLELGVGRVRRAVQSYRGATWTQVLTNELRDALESLSQREEVTLYMTLLAAFQTLLHRYTGEEDLLIGTPIANRTRREVEGLIGFFVNTLVIRMDASGNPRFGEMLQRVKEACLGAYAHQELPFEKLVGELQPERGLSHSPLFQVMFALQNAPMPSLELAGLTLEPMFMDIGTSRFDLSVAVEETGAGLRVRWEYSTDLFDETTIERMAGHFQTLLAGIASAPEQRLWQLPLLTVDERREILEVWNNTRRDYPNDARVRELFEAQAARTPDNTAVVCHDERMTYAELNRRANQLAHYLRRLGVRAETRVGLCVERSVGMIVGMMGILKAGGAYVPLDVEYPRERLNFMVEDAAISVLLTQARLIDRAPAHRGARVVRLDADWPTIDAESTTNPTTNVAGDNITYVIYTSGSTGKPKGVMVKDASLVNLCYGLRKFFDDAEVERVALMSSISFDISVNQIFPTLIFGKTLHLIRDEIKYDSRRLIEYVREHGINVFECVPSYLNSMLAELVAASANDQPAASTGNSLRYILIGGEKFEHALLGKAFAQLGAGVVMLSCYGLTEVTDISSCEEIRSRDTDDVITVGRPLQNSSVYILDRAGNLQPAGLTGEVCLGGDGISRGYLNRPELTAEKFIADPYGRGTTLCRTGDMGRWLKDGRFEVLGRMDQQVKVRGYRIEVGEIEAVMDECAGVCKSVVVARDDGRGEKRLVGYVLVDDEEMETSEVQRYALERLPSYMVPTQVVKLKAMPLLPNGKVNRQALPEAGREENQRGERYEKPKNAREEMIAGIWEEVLKAERLGVEDNFFEVGGHSLLMIQVQKKLSEASGQGLTMVEMFMHPTVRSLAEYMARRACAASSATGSNNGGASGERIEDGAIGEQVEKQSRAMRRRRELMKEIKRNE